jgi:hypothetical protein
MLREKIGDGKMVTEVPRSNVFSLLTTEGLKARSKRMTERVCGLDFSHLVGRLFSVRVIRKTDHV